MKSFIAILIVGLMLSGCHGLHGGSEQSADAGSPATTEQSGGVQPMTSPAAGGMTPVGGTDSVAGSGSGVGQAAKEKAKGLSGKAPTSLDNSGDEGHSAGDGQGH